jgi:hypothetical protein
MLLSLRLPPKRAAKRLIETAGRLSPKPIQAAAPPPIALSTVRPSSVRPYEKICQRVLFANSDRTLRHGKRNVGIETLRRLLRRG